MITASRFGQSEVVRLLVSRGANVNARVWAESFRRGEWRTPLAGARRGGYSDIVEFLVASGARE